jgi:hypothetical protein
MSRVLIGAVLVAALASPKAGAPKPEADPGLAEGKQQVASGRYEEAIATLSAVVRRLGTLPGQEEEVARAYLYLGVAYTGLGQMSPARSQFVQALKRDPSLTLDPGTAPPEALAALAAARQEGESEGVLPPDGHGKKKGPWRKALALGAVGAGVGVAAIAGASSHDSTAPSPTQTWTPIETSPYIQIVTSNPPPGSTFTVAAVVSVTLRAVNTGTVPEYPQLFFVVDAMTADRRACLSGETSPFSFLRGSSVTYAFPLVARCPVPFTTVSLEISLQDPETSQRPYHASYRGEFRVTP